VSVFVHLQAHTGVCPSLHTSKHWSILCLCVEVSLCGLNLGVPVCLVLSVLCMCTGVSSCVRTDL